MKLFLFIFILDLNFIFWYVNLDYRDKPVMVVWRKNDLVKASRTDVKRYPINKDFQWIYNDHLPDNIFIVAKKEKQMKCNVGKTDRIIRIIMGIGIIAAGVYFQSWWGAIGIIPIFTAAINWCPLYLPFGISSCKK